MFFSQTIQSILYFNNFFSILNNATVSVAIVVGDGSMAYLYGDTFLFGDKVWGAELTFKIHLAWPHYIFNMKFHLFPATILGFTKSNLISFPRVKTPPTETKFQMETAIQWTFLFLYVSREIHKVKIRKKDHRREKTCFALFLSREHVF